MKIQDKNLDTVIQNYVFGRLSEADAVEFEEYFLSNSEVIEQVEAAHHLRTGLQELETSVTEKSKTSGSIRNTNANKPFKSLLEKLLNLISIPVPAFAVIALTAVMLPFALPNLSQRDQESNINLVAFSTQATRSSNQKIVIDLSGANESSAILIKLKKIEFQNYKLKLSVDGESSPEWESKPFEPGPLRDKLVSLPPSLSGNFNLEVVSIGEDSKETPVEFCHYSELCK